MARDMRDNGDRGLPNERSAGHGTSQFTRKLAF